MIRYLRKNKKAFTLVEAMVAVFILLTIGSGILVSFIYCMILDETNRNSVIAANDAQYVLEQIKSLTYGDIAGYSAPVFTNFGVSGEETITLNRNIGAKIAEVTVNVQWRERGRNRQFSLSTAIAK